MGERRAAGALRQTEKCCNMEKGKTPREANEGVFSLSVGDNQYFHSPHQTQIYFSEGHMDQVNEIHSKWLDLMEKEICSQKL